jgi:homeobox-leucine zipper protein
MNETKRNEMWRCIVCLSQDNAGGGGMVGRMLPGGAGAGAADGGGMMMGRDADAENDSRSGSDHLDAMSAGGAEDEDDAEPGNPRKRKKRYHRHTPQQIQELEA